MIPGALMSLIALALSLAALGIRLIFKRSNISGMAAIIAALAALGYVSLFTLPRLATVISEWFRRMI